MTNLKELEEAVRKALKVKRLLEIELKVDRLLNLIAEELKR